VTTLPSGSPVSPRAGRPDRTAVIAACLQRARSGDREALDEVVRELNPLLWHVARAQGLAAEPAADVVQTTWLAFIQQMHAIRTPQAVTAWLVTATRREAWRVRARARAEVEPDTDAVEAIASAEPDVPERLLADERHRTLWRAVRRLPERCRELLRIVAMVERPDYAEVAESLGMPKGSIGPTRGRCLAKLRELLLADPMWSR
jgi:RNA polymerase sigma factor (sigma-70 family)